MQEAKSGHQVVSALIRTSSSRPELLVPLQSRSRFDASKWGRQSIHPIPLQQIFALLRVTRRRETGKAPPSKRALPSTWLVVAGRFLKHAALDFLKR
jgi:hypothetical protein